MGLREKTAVKKRPPASQMTTSTSTPPSEEVARRKSYPEGFIKKTSFIEGKDGRANVQGIELHGGCDDGRPTGCGTIAEKHGHSPHVGSRSCSLEDMAGHVPHGMTNVTGFCGGLVSYLGKKLEKLPLAVVVRPADEVADVGVIGQHGDFGPYWTVTFPNV